MLHEKAIRFTFVLLAFFALAGSARAAPYFTNLSTIVSSTTLDQDTATISWDWSDAGTLSYEFGVAVNYDAAQLLLTTDPVPPTIWALYPPDPGNAQPSISFAGSSQYHAYYDVEGIGSVLPGTEFDATTPQSFSMTFQILAAPAGNWVSNDITVSFLTDPTGPAPNGVESSQVFTISRNSDVVLSPVPEPETYAMVLAGLGLLGFMARRRKQKEAA